MDLPPVPCLHCQYDWILKRAWPEQSSAAMRAREKGGGAATDVAAGEVAALEHELRDDTVEGRALVTEAVLASAELTEVAGGLGDDVVVELEDNTAGLLWKAMQVSTLVFQDPG